MDEDTRVSTQLDKALDMMPLAPLPPDFVANVLNQIAPAAAASAQAPFRLHPADLAVPVASAMVFFLLILLTGLGGGAGLVDALLNLTTATPWLVYVVLLVVAELSLGVVLGIWLLSDWVLFGET